MTKERKEWELKGIKRNLDANLAFNEIPCLIICCDDRTDKSKYFLRAVEIPADEQPHVRDVGEISQEYGELIKELPCILTNIGIECDGAAWMETSFSGLGMVESYNLKQEDIANRAELDMFELVLEEIEDLQAHIDYGNPVRKPDGNYNDIFLDKKTSFTEFIYKAPEKANVDDKKIEM